MCEFFSFNTNGLKRVMYFTPKDIAKIMDDGNKKKYNFNSHASIADYFKYPEDKSNKYEYDPFGKKFEIDKINAKDDSEFAERWVKELFDFKSRKDFTKFCKNYLYKIDYSKIKKDFCNIPTKNDVVKLLRRIEKVDWLRPQKIVESRIKLKVSSMLKAFKLDTDFKLDIRPLENKSDWDSARASALASARASARDSAWDSALASARDSARDSALASALDSAWDSARDSALASALDSAWASALDSAWASAFEAVKDLMKKKGYKTNPFEKLFQLWEMGLYPCGLMKDKTFLIYYVAIKRKKEPMMKG